MFEARRAGLQQAVQQITGNAGAQLEDGLVQALLRAVIQSDSSSSELIPF